MIGLNSKQEGTVWEEVAPFPTVIRPPPSPSPSSVYLKPITKWPPVTVSADDLYNFTEKEGSVNSPTEQGTVCMGMDKM